MFTNYTKIKSIVPLLFTVYMTQTLGSPSHVVYYTIYYNYRIINSNDCLFSLSVKLPQ